MPRPSARKRVEGGAHLLDRNVPGWADRIDLSSLDIGTMDLCICGQLGGGHFDRGAELAGSRNEDEDFAYGFDSSTESDAEVLTQEWKRAIESRRSF